MNMPRFNGRTGTYGERRGVLEMINDATAASRETMRTVVDNIAIAASRIPGGIERVTVRETADAIPWKRYIKRINYSACNEDTGSEIAALRPGPGKHLIGITAGGGRILDLLVHRPDEVWAVDVNPCQNHLLELKIEAMRALDHGDFLAFMGVRRSDGRRTTFERSIRPRLSTEARIFFDTNPRLIEKGVLFQGNLERFFTTTAAIVNLMRPASITGLFACEDLESQRRFVERKWDSIAWRTLGPNLARRSFIQLFGDDPGFLRFLPDDVIVHRRIFDAIDSHIWNNVARENHLLQLAFFGKYVYEPAMPLYLRGSTFPLIKKALATTRIKVTTALISDVLADAPSETFDGFSFSDIASYFNDRVFHHLIEETIRTARPGAHLCSRRCLFPPQLPAEYARVIHRDQALEEHLKLHDHAMVHEFLVGEIRCGG